MDTKDRLSAAVSTSGLRSDCLPFSEVFAQSIANIAPTATPALTLALVFASAGTGTWLTYAIATLGLVFVGLNINQFARRSASPGSLYAYIAKGLGPTAGVIAGWALIVAYLFTGMTVLCGFANFAQVLLSPTGIAPSPVFLVAIAAGIGWYLAYRDIQLSAALMLWLEITSLAIIMLLGVIVLFHKGTLIDPAQLTLKGATPSGMMYGLVLGILSFVGFESATTLGDEAKAPLKTIPRAVIFSTVVSGLFFVIVGYIEVFGFDGLQTSLKDSASPLNDLAQAASVGFFGVLISACALVSMFACVLACMNAGSRILFTMGRHSVIHRTLGRAHRRNGTPHVAVTLAAVVMFLCTAALLLSGVTIINGFIYFGTIAAYGFLTAYILISIAAPCYLARERRLKFRHILYAIAGVGIMSIPLVSSIGIPGEGSLFPVPPTPFNLFPYLFLLYLAIGTGWFIFLRMRFPRIIQEIEEDIESIHLRFSDMHKI